MFEVFETTAAGRESIAVTYDVKQSWQPPCIDPAAVQGLHEESAALKGCVSSRTKKGLHTKFGENYGTLVIIRNCHKLSGRMDSVPHLRSRFPGSPPPPNGHGPPPVEPESYIMSHPDL